MLVKNTLECLHTRCTSAFHLLRRYSFFQFLLVSGSANISTPHSRRDRRALLSSSLVSLFMTPLGFCKYSLMSLSAFCAVMGSPIPGSASYLLFAYCVILCCCIPLSLLCRSSACLSFRFRALRRCSFPFRALRMRNSGRLNCDRIRSSQPRRTAGLGAVIPSLRLHLHFCHSGSRYGRLTGRPPVEAP